MPDTDEPEDNTETVFMPSRPPAVEPAAPAPAAAPAADPPAVLGRVSIGDVLNGIYEVKRLIARGGMGEVYEGVNINSDERVAIKVMLPSLASDAKVQAMFRKEARTLTRLAHPAVVQYRVLAHEPRLNVLYIVTEFVDGVELTGVLGQIHPNSAELRSLIRRLADGLRAAHELGAVHRDMSPDNVLLPDRRLDRARIIDFGIAKDLDPTKATIVGDGFAGKLAYVAPEQFGDFGREIGPWTDIYSLGLVIMALATGKDVDMGTTLVEAVDKRRQGIDLSPLPEDLRPILGSMLQADPAKRARSMDQVLAMLDEHDRTTFPPTTSIPPVTTTFPTAAQATLAPSQPPVSIPPNASIPAEPAAPPPTTLPPQPTTPPVTSFPAQTTTPPVTSFPAQPTTPPVTSFPAQPTTPPVTSFPAQTTTPPTTAFPAHTTTPPVTSFPATTIPPIAPGSTIPPGGQTTIPPYAAPYAPAAAAPDARPTAKRGPPVLGLVVSALAVLVVVGGGVAYLMLPKGPPRQVVAPTTPTTTVTPTGPVVAVGPTTTPDQAISAALPSVSCSWIDVVGPIQNGQPVKLSGAAGSVATVQVAVLAAAKSAGDNIAPANIDVTSVTQAGQGACTVLDAFRPFKAASGAAALASAQPAYQITRGSDGKLAGEPSITLAPRSPGQDFALLRMDANGRLSVVYGSRQAFDAARQGDSSITDQGGDAYTVQADALNAAGVGGLLLLTGNGPFDAALLAKPPAARDLSWVDQIRQAATTGGWKSTMVWYKVQNNAAPVRQKVRTGGYYAHPGVETPVQPPPDRPVQTQPPPQTGRKSVWQRMFGSGGSH